MTACRRDGVIIIGATWWNGLLAGMSLALGAIFVVRTLLSCRERTVCATHALMGVAMAGMFWPSGDPTPAAVGASTFAVIGAWFAGGWLRAGSGRTTGAAHVVVGSAAMVLMYLVHAGGAAHPGHSGHGGSTAAGGSGALLAVGGLLFTGYFVWHAWELIARRPASAHVDGAVLRREHAVRRTVPAAQVAMSGLMVVMLLGTV